MIYKEKKVFESAKKTDHYSAKWNISDSGIKEAMEKFGTNDVSFYFVFRWL